jgi:nitrite reductase/ring-hydroxylating ferredoxin subunit/uncharacterized membrane protein
LDDLAIASLTGSIARGRPIRKIEAWGSEMTVFQKLITRIEDSAALDGLSRPLMGLAGRATRPDVVKNALSGTWLGERLHPLLTDLPIGAWVMAAVLDWTGGRRGAEAARRLVGLGVWAALPAASAGASDWSDTDGGEQRVGVVHGLLNLTGAALQSFSWLARRRGRRVTGMALSTAALGVTVSAAYLGGHLSFVRGVGVDHTAFDATIADWTEVVAVSELSPDKPVRVSAGGVPVMVVLHAGTVRALSATCVHAGGPLDGGDIVDASIRCPWHASRFALADGKVLRGPAASDAPAWEVRVDDGRVAVRSSSSKRKG